MDSLIASAIRLITGASATWVDCRPSTHPRIYYANHSSNLDAAVIWASLPQVVRAQTRAVAANDYWGQGGLKGYLAKHVFNAILVERGKKEEGGEAKSVRPNLRANFEAMTESLKAGQSLIIFPEGTRDAGEELLDFKPGIYHLAKQVPEVELVPVYLHNLNRVLPKGELIFVPLVCSVTFGRPVRYEKKEKRDLFLTRAREGLLALRQMHYED